MKVLIVTMGFFPGERYGGPPVSVDNFCRLMDGYECFVVTKDHDLGDSTRYPEIQEGWNDRGNCKVRYLPDARFRKDTFEEIIRQLQPDWIYLQSLFQSCVISCLSLGKKYGIKVMLAPRGELCKGAFRKKYKKLPYIAALRLMGLMKGVSFQSTSEEESEAIGKYLGATKEQIHLLPNIPSVSRQDCLPYRKTPGSARLVFLSRIHPKKNLLAALRALRAVAGEVTFDIYGPLEDQAYWELCQQMIQTLPENIRVSYCGATSHEQVHRVFSEYDAFLFPTLSENYGHVIVEAMSVGCPVILSDQTPWSDVQAHGAGWAIPLDREDGFTAAIQQVVAWEQRPDRQVKAYLEEKIDIASLREGYRMVFEA